MPCCITQNLFYKSFISFGVSINRPGLPRVSYATAARYFQIYAKIRVCQRNSIKIEDDKYESAYQRSLCIIEHFFGRGDKSLANKEVCGGVFPEYNINYKLNVPMKPRIIL